MVGLSTLQSWRSQDIAILMYKVNQRKTTINSWDVVKKKSQMIINCTVVFPNLQVRTPPDL